MEILWSLLGLAVLLIAAVIMMHNSIITAYNLCKRAWADVHTYERQKVAVLEALEPLLRQYAAHEGGTLKEVTALRAGIRALSATELDPHALAAIRTRTARLLEGLSVVVENYPELKASSLYQEQMKNIRDQNENVGAAIAIFNRNVEIFNSRIESIPGNLVNHYLTHKSRIDEFHDPLAAGNIAYQPNF